MKRLILLLMLGVCFEVNAAELIIQTQENTYMYQTDIADTVEKQQLGLMFQKELPENYGMTFLFDKKRTASLRFFFVLLLINIPLDFFFDPVGKAGVRQSFFVGFDLCIKRLAVCLTFPDVCITIIKSITINVFHIFNRIGVNDLNFIFMFKLRKNIFFKEINDFFADFDNGD